MLMEPGDLTVSQIEAVFGALAEIRRLALAGEGDREIAFALEWRPQDVRAGARLMGFTVSDLVRRQHLCPACGWLTEPDGHCEVCHLRRRLKRLAEVNEEEHRREVERLNRDNAALRQDTKRVRQRNGTNPRMKRATE